MGAEDADPEANGLRPSKPRDEFGRVGQRVAVIDTPWLGSKCLGRFVLVGGGGGRGGGGLSGWPILLTASRGARHMNAPET